MQLHHCATVLSVTFAGKLQCQSGMAYSSKLLVLCAIAPLCCNSEFDSRSSAERPLRHCMKLQLSACTVCALQLFVLQLQVIQIVSRALHEGVAVGAECICMAAQ